MKTLGSQISTNSDLLEILFQLYSQNREFDNAFDAILKKKDPKVFEFLDK